MSTDRDYEAYMKEFRKRLTPLPTSVLVDMSILIDAELQWRYEEEDEIERQRNRPMSYKLKERD